MRRTQLYLDDTLWEALHAQARRDGTTISELVRNAARERYLGRLRDRGEAMLGIIGLRKDRDLPVSTDYIRELRRGQRIGRLGAREHG